MLFDCIMFSIVWVRTVSRGAAGSIASGAGRRPKPSGTRPFGSTGLAPK